MGRIDVNRESPVSDLWYSLVGLDDSIVGLAIDCADIFISGATSFSVILKNSLPIASSMLLEIPFRLMISNK